MMFPVECVFVETGWEIVFRENNRSFRLLNPNGHTLRKVRFDGCVITHAPGQMACDYGAWVDSQNLAYLIELKGKDIVHAIRQIQASLDYIRANYSNEIRERTIHAVIVSSRNNVPNLKQSPAYIRLKRSISSVQIKNRELELNL